jgi:hypothetical protein
LEKENPDRWTSDRQAHFDWCISWDGAYAEPAREGSYRVVGLKDCAAKEAMQQGGVLSDRPGAKETIPTTTPPPPKFCKVNKDSVVYDMPDGNQIGELAAQTQGVTLLKKQGDNNYDVKWPAGEGWVYSGPGYEDAIECP